MERTILPILIMTNRQGRKSKTAANFYLSIYGKKSASVEEFFFKDKKRERERKNRKKEAVPLPQWPSSARREQWDVPWLHSDTFIITKKTTAVKKNMDHKGRQKGRGD